jgi:hypothetical protein
MAKLEIKFSTAEMLLITSSMKIASFPNLSDNFDQRYSEDELRIMLETARESLMARGLVRIKEKNGRRLLDLHPIVKAAVGVAARPEKGWWLTITGEKQKPRSIFFSWTEQLIVNNWVTEEGTFCFEQVEEETLPSAILNFSKVNPQDKEENPIKYEVPVKILDAIVENKVAPDSGLQKLIQAGITETDASQILENIDTPIERCILIAVTNMRKQPKNVGLIVWFKTKNQIWLIEQSNDKDIAILKKVSGSTILEAISSLTAIQWRKSIEGQEDTTVIH